MTRESGLTHSDLKEGDVLISINKHDDIYVVLSSRENNTKDQLIIRLLDLQNGNMLSTRVWAHAGIFAGYKLLRREEGGA